MIAGARALLQRLRPARPGRIAQARPGQRIRLRGRVAPRDLMDSPLGGERCVYYRYSVESWRRSVIGLLSGDGFWERHEQDEAIAEFYLDDDGARALISPVGAVVSTQGAEPLEVALDAADRRARELTIRPGDRIEVVGLVGEVLDLHDEGRDYRSDARRLALFEPTIRLLDRRRAT